MARALAPFVVAISIVLGAVLWQPSWVYLWQPNSYAAAPASQFEEEVLLRMQVPGAQSDLPERVPGKPGGCDTCSTCGQTRRESTANT